MKKTTSKLLSLLLALVMVLGMLPMSAFAADNNVINSVSINNVAEPVMGVQSSVSAKLPSDCDYSLRGSSTSWFVSSKKIDDLTDIFTFRNGLYWYNSEVTGVDNRFDGKFESGKYFTFVCQLKPDEGCRFSDSVTATINGKQANVSTIMRQGREEHSEYANGILVWQTFGPVEYIDSVSINNVAEPMMGVQSSVSAKLPSDCDYSLRGSSTSWFVSSKKIDDLTDIFTFRNGLYWYNSEVTGVDNRFDGKFESGKYFTFVCQLKPDEGCRFSDSVTATINGQPANVSTIMRQGREEHSEYANGILVWQSFGELTPIDYASVSVTPPKVGMTANAFYATVPNDVGYESAPCAWIETGTKPDTPLDAIESGTFMNNSVFQQGKYYTAVCYLKPKATDDAFYNFRKNTTAQINGNPADVTLLTVDGKTQLVAAYTFIPTDVNNTLNPRWDGYTARWNDPTNGGFEYKYDFSLFKNGVYQGKWTNLTELSKDVTASIRAMGTGDYSFQIDSYVKQDGKFVPYYSAVSPELRLSQNPLTGIRNTKRPNKITYTVGETFDPTGLTVEAVYANGNKKDITSSILSQLQNIQLNETGSIKIEYSYTEDNVTKSAFYYVTVEEARYRLSVTNGVAQFGELKYDEVHVREGREGKLIPNAAPAGYEFDKWTVVTDNVTLTPGADNTATFTMPKGEVEVKAEFKEIPKYDIHLALADGRAKNGNNAYCIRAVAGDTITIIPNDMSGAGKAFSSWTVTSNGNPVSITPGANGTATFTMPAAEVTITANYTTSYRITFVYHDGNNYISHATLYTDSDGKLATLPTVPPTPDGYVFKGWARSSDVANIITTDTIFNGNCILRAQWQDADIPDGAPFVIHFITRHNGLKTYADIETDKYGVLQSLPTAPTRDGFIFKGWYTEQNGGGDKVEVGTEFEKNTFVEPYWERNLAEALEVVITPSEAIADTSVYDAEVILEGYAKTDLGNNDYDLTWTTDWTGDADAVKIEKATEQQHKLYVSKSVPDGTVITITATSNDDPTKSATATVIVNKDPNYAHVCVWEIVDGNPRDDFSEEFIYTKDDEVIVYAPSSFDYIFTGWGNWSDIEQYVVAGGGTQTSNKLRLKLPKGRLDLYACYETPVGGVVFLDPNDGELNCNGVVGLDNNGKISDFDSIADPSYEGHIFLGWYTAETGGNKVNANTVLSDEDAIYAQWKPSYTIMFDANGGTINAFDPSIGTVGIDGTLITTLPTPTRTGYTLKGWYTEPTGGTQVTAATVFDADATIYAQWTMQPHTVTFNKNYTGAGAAEQIQTDSDGKLNNQPQEPTRQGYAFKGWYTAQTGGSAVDTTNLFTEDTTLYAQWNELDVVLPVTVAIDTSTLTDATKGSSYSKSLAAAVTYSTDTAVKWSIISGALPSGLSLNATTGVIFGTPTECGEFSFTVKATHATEASATKDFTLTVNAVPEVLDALLSTGTVGKSYSAQVYADAGYPISSLEWSANGLPAGLTIDKDTGVISGTPTAAGTTTFTVIAKNSVGESTAKSFTLDIKEAPPKTYYLNLLGGTGYTAATVEGYPDEITEGGEFKFTITINEGYVATGDFNVKANGDVLSGSKNGNVYSFTISNVKAHQNITVEGVEATFVANPVISPNGGAFDDEVEVAIYNDNADPNVKIYYTIDGSDPTDSTNTNRKEYTAPFTLTLTNNKETVRAAAVSGNKTPGTASAEFSKKQYTITVVDDGNGTGIATPATAAKGDTVTLKATPNPGYRFKAWEAEAGFPITITNNQFEMPGHNVYIYATFENIPDGGGGGHTYDYYTLTFNTNGGSSIAPVTRIEGTTVNLASYKPTKAGYDFTGWYADAALNTKITSITLNSNKTVYAGWKFNEEINPNTGAWVNPFIDVFEKDWFYDDVRFAYENDLMKGTSSNTFSPNVTTTRGMIVTVLYRLEGEPTVSGACPFDDVKSGMYYEDAITWAAQHNIVGGYGNAKFGPEDDITREQMAAILYRYADYKGYNISGKNDLAAFTDTGKISSYALDNVKWAVDAGLINGMGDGTLAPQGNGTRAQIAAILHRFIDKFVK